MLRTTEVTSPNNDVATLISKAAADAQAAKTLNASKESGGIRPSRAGLPLLQIVLEDFILPKLPKQENTWKQDPFAIAMRLATGYLFESSVKEQLLIDYPGCDVESQPALTITCPNGTTVINGSADFVVYDHEKKTAVVVECKALKADSVEEVRYQKLLCDNWGYFTQLTLYIAGVKQQHPSYRVTGVWYVWIKQLEKHTKIKYPATTAAAFEQALTVIQQKATMYNDFKQAVADNKLCFAVGQLLRYTEELPEKYFNDGYYKGSCGVHFNRYVSLLLDKRGFLLDSAEDTLLLMTRAAVHGHDSEYAKVLVDKLTTVK